MSELLQTGQVIQSKSGVACTVGRFLGGGGQGEVYEGTWAGKPVAIKWYFEASATADQRATIEALVAEGSPSDRFLWPIDIVSCPKTRGFGYLMGLRPARFKSLTDLMAGKINPSFDALLTAGFELARAFRQIHTKGLCYRDISFGNAFFDPANGAVLICDNDNVGVRTSASGVLGTPDFMAPEIVRAQAVPSAKTDAHSLAVLLFYILFVGHPLQGGKILKIRAWDRPARELLFGHEPVFIFDPQDKSNAAVELSMDPSGEAGGTSMMYWSIYPTVLRDTFTKAFTVGLREPDQRVTELEWQDALIATRNAQFKCTRCGATNFFDPRRHTQAGSPTACRSDKCRAPLVPPLRIQIRKEVTVLSAETRLHEHHLDGSYNFSQPVAEVVRHPTDPNVWGLKNLTAAKWVGTFPDGAVKDIEPGRSVPLGKGVRVNFGRVEGQFVA